MLVSTHNRAFVQRAQVGMGMCIGVRVTYDEVHTLLLTLVFDSSSLLPLTD